MKELLKRVSPRLALDLLIRVKGIVQGKWPESVSQKTLVRVASPTTLSGKILYKMAMDRNPLLTTFADKLAVQEYVKNRIGEKYLNSLIAYSDSTEFLRSLRLPSNFALKSNNGSGGMILVWENAPKGRALPLKAKEVWAQHLIHPDHFNVQLVEKIAEKWLSSNYSYRPGRFPEWAYKDIKPMLLVEQLMFDDQGQLPSDYKFFMIEGKCSFIQVDTSRFDGHKRNLFTPDWDVIEGLYQHPASIQRIARPRSLKEMLEVAESLSNGVDFVRVDLYETSLGVKFGELTNYPGGGMERFDPESLDFDLGITWQPKY